MMRLLPFLFCLISVFSWCQEDTSSVEVDSVVLEPDFVPLKLNGEWVWYDIVNGKPSDSIFITNFVQNKSGYYANYVVRDTARWGILDLSGEIVRPFAFDSIISIDGHLLTLFNDQWSYRYFDEFAGDTLIHVSFDSLYPFDADLYLYDKGKVGLILKDRTIIQPKYDGIHQFGCYAEYDYERHFMTIVGKEYNLLNSNGKEILPKGVWDLRCTEDGVYEFRRGKNPEYYHPLWEELIDPNGRDIVFYGGEGYKVYNEDNSRSELRLWGEEVLKDRYDDYFLLNGGYIAVRKDGKVGLTKDGVQILGEIKYDQINPVEQPMLDENDYQWYFKFYHGDSCGLMDDLGNELFGAGYANILIAQDHNRFIVLDRNLSGVVDRNGEVVIPLKYHSLFLENGSNQFIVQHNAKIGLFDYDGTQKTPIEYDGYRRLQTFNDGDYRDAVLALKKGGKYYFANNSGFIDPTGFDHYNHSNDVLKTYSASAISVFLFDQRGQIEDRTNYPVYRKAVIRRNYQNHFGNVGGWAVSELEENQKEGYFGLRYYKKRGFGVLPRYRTVRGVIFRDYLGEVEVEQGQYSLTNELSADVIRGFHALYTGSGSTNGVNYVGSELSIIRGGSGDRYISRKLNGGQDRAYSKELGSSTIDLSEKIHYSDIGDLQNLYRRYFKGGEVELCPIDSSDVSFYNYFKYHNSTDGLRVSPEIMKMILNPQIGVRFKGARCEIINASVSGARRTYRKYRTAEEFDEYNYLNGSIFFEKLPNKETGSLRFGFLPKKDKKEVRVDEVIGASVKDGLNFTGSQIVAEVKKSRMAKIHVDYPDFFFYRDSIDLSYEAGRVTRRLDSNTVRLITPDGRIVADSCVMIRYLKEERFALLRKNGWQLIDKNGELITHKSFSAVSEFKHGRAEFRYSDGTAVIINEDGKELMPLPEPRVFLDADHYHFASNPKKLINRHSKIEDQAQDGEEYTSKGFFVSKNDGKTVVRRFGSSDFIALKSIPKLKVFGSCLYYKKGKNMYSIDSNLAVTKFKKMDKFRVVTPEIGWLQGKKDQLIDFDWNYICKMSKDERFELKDGNLIVFENDSVYRNFGSLKPVSKYPELLINTPAVGVIYEQGKYGAKREQDTILPVRYNWLSKINDKEFMTRTDSERHLYDHNLKRIGNRPFDRFIETGKGNFVFFQNGQVFVLFNDRKTVGLVN